MKRVVDRIVGRAFGTCNIQIDDDGLLSAAHDYGFHRFILAGVQFLMRDVRGDVDEISGAGFVDEFEIVSPKRKRARPRTT